MPLIVKDMGWGRVVEELQSMDNTYVKVGFPEEGKLKSGRKKGSGHKPYEDISELAKIAAKNEYGSGNIPERSFMRTSMKEMLPDLTELKKRLYIRIVKGVLTTRKALDIIGLYAVKRTKRKIVQLRNPPNAPYTIRKKKSSNPLIDTGQLLNSVQHEVKG